MDKQFVTVGIEIPAFSKEYISLQSEQSILDYDIVIFRPDISEFIVGGDFFQGKRSLGESSSFRLRQAASRWRNALREAFTHGKTVFVFMSELQEVFLDTGRREYSGTGRNRQTTNIVEPFNNYSMLPLSSFELTTAHGKEIKPAGDLKILTEYWAKFADASSYDVYFDCKSVTPLLITRTGNKTVGGISQNVMGATGALILLPILKYDKAKFTQTKEGKDYWTKEAAIFGENLHIAFREIDKILGTARQLTPPPDWVREPHYRLSIERELESSITGLGKQLEELQKQRADLSSTLGKAGTLRRLLFEKGVALEEAILEALDILGLKAQRFKNAESEFDAVFEWKGRRFIGEAEGKDSKAIAIDKMSQLERNLNEDFAREEVKDYAKGILFGNAFRLQQPSERPGFFTEKCASAAVRIKSALVRTPDLFLVAKYVKESGDSTYGEECIEAILRAEGTVVEFPTAPTTPESTRTTKSEKQSAT